MPKATTKQSVAVRHLEVSVDNLFLGERFGLIEHREIAPRIVQLIDDTPARERPAFLELLRKRTESEVKAALYEYEWRSRRE